MHPKADAENPFAKRLYPKGRKGIKALGMGIWRNHYGRRNKEHTGFARHRAAGI